MGEESASVDFGNIDKALSISGLVFLLAGAEPDTRSLDSAEQTAIRLRSG